MNNEVSLPEFTEEEKALVVELHNSKFFPLLVKIVEYEDRVGMSQLKVPREDGVAQNTKYWQGYCAAGPAILLRIKAQSEKE